MPEVTEARGRFRRLNKLFFWAAMIIFSLLGILTAFWLPGRWELHEKLSQLRGAGLPTNGAELDAFYSIPDGTDDTTDLWVSALEAANTEEIHQSAKTLPFVGSGSEPVDGEEWVDLAAARTFLAERKQVIAAIHTAAEAGGMARFPDDYSDGVTAAIENTQTARTVTRLLTLDAHVSLRDGNDERVLRDLIAEFALSDATSNQPIIISHLVRIAIHSIAISDAQRFISECQWNDIQLAELQHAFAAAEIKNETQLALHGERVIGLSVCDEVPLSALHQTSKLEILQFYANLINAFENSWPEILQEVGNIGGEVQMGESDSIVKLPYQTVNEAIQTSARATALQRCGITAIAVQRYRLLNGNFPDSLTEVLAELFPAGFAATESSDPFSGESLRYLMNESGCTVYSIGTDGSDNGGKVRPTNGQPSSDVGFTLKR